MPALWLWSLVTWLSSQNATLQWSISEAVIAATLLSAHKLLANLTSPISMFCFVFFFASCKLYPGGDKSATRPHKTAPSVFMSSRQERQSVVFASVNLPSSSGGWKMKAVGPQTIVYQMQDLVCTFSPASTVKKIKNVKVTCACFWRENKDSNVLADSISGSHSLPCSLKEGGSGGGRPWEGGGVGE